MDYEELHEQHDEADRRIQENVQRVNIEQFKIGTAVGGLLMGAGLVLYALGDPEERNLHLIVGGSLAAGGVAVAAISEGRRNRANNCLTAAARQNPIELRHALGLLERAEFHFMKSNDIQRLKTIAYQSQRRKRSGMSDEDKE